MEQNQFAIYGTRVVLDVDVVAMVSGSSMRWWVHAKVVQVWGITIGTHNISVHVYTITTLYL